MNRIRSLSTTERDRQVRLTDSDLTLIVKLASEKRRSDMAESGRGIKLSIIRATRESGGYSGDLAFQ